jgi:ABC-type antimicrobial peptide transport system permease subunit
MDYAVARRTREIGIRLALGAVPGQVLRLMLIRGARLAGLGIALGLVGAHWATRLLAGVLYGVRPEDPATLSIVVAVVAAAALLACYVPIRRAMKLEPTVALKAE